MKQRTAFSLQSIFFSVEALCLAALAVLLLVFPKQTAAGVTQGLRLCFSSLVGSILPFLVVTKLFLLRGLHRLPVWRRSFFVRRVLRLPQSCAAVFVFSMVGGYPVGASMATDLWKCGGITRKQAQNLLLFCVGPGPSFAVSAVGVGMLGSAKAGVVLYASVVIGAVLTGMIARLCFGKKAAAPEKEPPAVQPLPVAESVDRAVRESVQTMVLICGFVALFQALLALPKALGLPQSAIAFAAAVLEVTGACRYLSPLVPLPVLALAAAWGGVCTHCQLSPFLGALELPYGKFLVFRAVHAGCSFLCCRALLAVVRLPAGAMQQSVIRPAVQQSYLLSFCMCAMCVLLLLGSRFSIRLTRIK